MSHIDMATFEIIVGNPRSSDLVKMARALAKLRLSGKSAEYAEAAFDHLTKLTGLRNQIAHYSGVAGFGEVALYSKPGKAGERPYSKTTIDKLAAAQFDLTNVINCIRTNTMVAGAAYRPMKWTFKPISKSQ